jgi:phosphomannomutase
MLFLVSGFRFEFFFLDFLAIFRVYYNRGAWRQLLEPANIAIELIVLHVNIKVNMIYNKNIFKAYDIRGKYPSEIDESAVAGIAEAVSGYLYTLRKRGKRKIKIVVGRDARLSSPHLYEAVVRGIMKNEKRTSLKPSLIHNSSFIIHAVGIITTPMLYFLVNDLECDGGIIVTASHNPPNFNGLKVVGKDARPISGEEIYLMATSGISI